jgi:geranyl-CoA carboxylase alpha subunit
LPLRQEDVHLSGHAVEVRLYAEDPYRGFLPQAGRVAEWRPASGAGVRIDHGLRSGQEVSPYYDPMLAKVIAYGATREEARRRLILALEDTSVLGLNTNRGFLLAMLRHPEFAEGEATTAFIGKHFAPSSPAMKRPEPTAEQLALAGALLLEAARAGSRSANGTVGAWRSTGAGAAPMWLAVGQSRHALSIADLGQGQFRVVAGDKTIDIVLLDRGEGHVRFLAGGRQRRASYAFADGTLHLDLEGVTIAVRDTLYEMSEAADADGDARLLAPMNGRIVAVLAKPGEKVAKGQRIVVLEAMKMQHEIAAGRDGVLAEIPVKEGDQVTTRQLLAALEPGRDGG